VQNCKDLQQKPSELHAYHNLWMTDDCSASQLIRCAALCHNRTKKTINVTKYKKKTLPETITKHKLYILGKTDETNNRHTQVPSTIT